MVHVGVLLGFLYGVCSMVFSFFYVRREERTRFGLTATGAMIGIYGFGGGLAITAMYGYVLAVCLFRWLRIQ